MKKISETINVFVAVIAGILMIGLAFVPEFVVQVLQTAGQGALAALSFIIGVVVVVTNVLEVLREHDGSYVDGGSLEIVTDEGTSSLSLHALEVQLMGEMARFADLSDVRLKLRPKGEAMPIACAITCKLKRQEDVTGRLDQVKKAVRDAFVRLIPSGAGIEVSCYVTDLVDDTPVSAKKESSSSSEFSGPVYPIDANEGA